MCSQEVVNEQKIEATKADKKLIKQLAKAGEFDEILQRFGAKWVKKARSYASEQMGEEEGGDGAAADAPPASQEMPPPPPPAKPGKRKSQQLGLGGDQWESVDLEVELDDAMEGSEAPQTVAKEPAAAAASPSALMEVEQEEKQQAQGEEVSAEEEASGGSSSEGVVASLTFGGPKASSARH